MTSYLLYRLASLASNLLPRAAGNWVALRAADLCYLSWRSVRQAVRANLRTILGPDASEAHLRYQTLWTFRCFGKYMAEFVGNRRYDASFIDRCVTFRGIEHFDAARRAGRGAVLVSAHLGNWELGGAAMSCRGTPVLAIVQPHPNARVHRFFMSQRESLHYRVLPVGAAALPILRHLRSNGIVALLGDRPYGEEGVVVDFCGRPALFASGPARLALATGTPMIPAFVLRRYDDSFTIVLEPPIPHPAGGAHEDRVRRMMQDFARVLEDRVRDNPSQWLAFYPVWDGPGRAQADPRLRAGSEMPAAIRHRIGG
ncbi:MAG TPA: lysophospholipid acyltransferase family protein [Planctomycetota bacterium]|nr:lysophospholipid acyltransferase family protein [Planctomycetota bacterium]